MEKAGKENRKILTADAYSLRAANSLRAKIWADTITRIAISGEQGAREGGSVKQDAALDMMGPGQGPTVQASKGKKRRRARANYDPDWRASDG